MILFIIHHLYSYKNDNCIIYPTRTVPVIKRLSNFSVTPSTRAITRDSAALKDQDPKESVRRLARNTAQVPPMVLLPHQRGLGTPDFVKLLPTKAPRGSARNTGLMISVRRHFKMKTRKHNIKKANNNLEEFE